ncbi:SseB family protein [Micromonospora sp. WMMD987]|uniref:SseB family protein n=1 Tax=Micromonospora sp. WMMD987 TaxID=3016089 RepID=UPI00249B2A57|nr:SseB family protein [Micromonospora sp. WMMD987]WFE95923.1 SseB family protein [Micromonospora sp. WMMD987]
MTDWEPATEAEAGMRDALRVGDQERYFRILAGTDLFLPVSGQALAGAAPMGWGTWTTGGRTHVLAFTSTAAVHACLGVSAGPCRRSRYADLAVEWPNHEWWLAVNPGLPIEGYLPAWFVSQLSRGDVRLPGRATGVRSRPEHEQTPGRNRVDGASDGEPTADLSAGPAGWIPPRPAPPAGTVPPASAVPPGGGVPRPAGGTASTGERGRPVTPPATGPLDATGGHVDGRPAGPASPADPAARPGRPTTVPRRRVLAEEPTGSANGRASFFEPSNTRGASRSPRENPLRAGERAVPPARTGLGGQPFPRRRPAPAVPAEDEATRAFQVGSPAEQPVRPAAGNGTTTVGRRPDPLADEPTRAFRVGPSAAEALPRRRIPDGASGAAPPRPSTDPSAAPAAPAGPVPDEAEELSPSAAEPVSAPPAARRGFTPIVIEGVILESRDLPVVPAPAPAPPVVPVPSPVPPPPPVPPVVPSPPAAPVGFMSPTAPGPATGRPDAGSTVTRTGAAGPLVPPARPVAPGPVSPQPSTRPRSDPGDLWTPATERVPVSGSSSPAAPAPAPESTVAGTPVTAPDAWSTTPDGTSVPTGAPAAPVGAPAAPVGAPDTSAGAPAAPSVGGQPDSAVPPVVASPGGVDAPGTGPAPTATGAPDSAAPGQAVPPAPAAPSESPAAPVARADPDDLWTPAAERAGRAAGRIGPTAADRAAPVSPAPGPAPESTPPGSAPESTPPGSAPESTPPVPPPVAGPDAATSVDELFQPANEVEENLLDAAGTGSTDGFLSTLLLARVLLPVNPDSASGSRPGEPGFAWRTVTTDGETCVVVYTSPERLAEHDVSPVETIGVRFVQLIRRWPDPSWAFTVNPGTPVGAKLPGEQIVALASWAAEVGLGDEADLEPVAAAAPAERTRYAPPATDPSRPVVMQKAIAPSQLAYYLERGYDRVSGFVHRAGELAHLTTPAELYDALGLGYPDSPFTRDAEAAYVLRWPAYRPSLYRIPYGGQNEAAMRAMEGWVIERAPFRGNGFAPGESSDVVAEFKVDSARLPHGAQLWRIGAEGTERVIAVLDTDALVWRRMDQQ